MMLMRWTIQQIDYGVADIHPSPMSIYPLIDAVHYLCPACGTVWAQVLPVEITGGIYHKAHHLPCPDCGVTGSLNPTREQITFLPRKVLERELDIACEHPAEWAILSRQLKGDQHAR